MGIAPPYGVAANGAYFYGFQLEEGASMSPVFTYTYNNTVSATTVTFTVDPRLDSLEPGVGATYQVTLTLIADIVNNHQVLVNTVTATGVFVTPGGNSLQATSTSDDPLTAQQDDPTIISLVVTPSVEITKTASVTDVDASGTTSIGDMITYTITVSNTGDTPLNNISITDVLSGLNTGTLSLSTSLTHVSSSLGSASDTLAIGEFSTFTVTFTVNDDAYYFGGTRNVASVQADAPRVIGGSQTVTDTSENVDHPIEDPLIEVTKTVSHTDTDGDGEVSVGDVLVYNVTLENIGNVTLQSIFLVDDLTDLSGNTRNYDGAGLQFNNDSSLGSAEGVLLAKEVATYTATYTIVGADVTAGGVMNQVVATSYIYPNGNATVYAQDESDDGDDEDGNTQDDETITFTGQLNSFEVTKTAAKVDDGNGVDNIGDKIVFTITVSNTGADQINDLTFTDTLTSARGVPLSLDSQPEFVSGTNGSTATTLALGGVITYTATFTVTQQILDEGGVYNTITFSGSSARNPNPAEHDTEDVSDNGDDTDGNTEDDPTFFAVGLDNDQDGIPDLLDIDDDNDGVLDTFEKCIDFSVDGFSFENYDTGGGGPVDSNTNYNSTFPVANKVAPFTSVDGRGRIWDARVVNGKNWTPYDPSNPDEAIFMELLQSATISGTADPANTQADWNETSYGIPDFDRIMAQEYVYPNTTYNLTFYHMDGGISSATFADGGSTLVQIQGMDSDYAVSQLTEAPSDWAQQTFQFTTGPTTNKIAILFSAYADGSDVAILLDKIGLTPQISINCDVDSDGVGNGIDLDSDNDGIYDVVEAGNADLDTNGDGMIDENDAGFVDANANGAHDTIEGRTPTDTDSDTTVDMFDLDSDNDGCNDTSEAGYTDGDDDGLLGDSPVTVDAEGKVTSGTDGYTDPSDLNSNGTKDYQEDTYDIACYNENLGLEMTKTAQTIDVNSDGVLGLNDQIVYTVVITNTGEIALPLQITDLLTNQDSQTIETLDLEFVGLSTPTIYNVPKNYIKRSVGFNYNSFDDNYWHRAGSTGDNSGAQYLWQPLNAQPAEALVYFSTDSGASENQTGFTNGIIQSLPKEVNNNNVKSLISKTTPGFSDLNPNSNYYNHFVRLRNGNAYTEGQNAHLQWIHHDVEGLQPNSQYTVSVFAYPYNSNNTGSDRFDKGFQFVFHDGDSNSDNWTGNYIVNWNNAQKSPRYYFDDLQVYRFSHTFTTDASVGTTRVGISLPNGNNQGAWFYGFQLEEGASMSPVFNYTYNNTVSATTAGLILDPRIGAIAPGAAATYQVTLTLSADIVNNHQVLVNSVTATGTFVTPGGNSLQTTSTSDDPLTAQEDDPTIISLVVTPSVEITKTASVTDVDSSGGINRGDIISYTITVSNTGDTPLNNITITDVLSGLNTGTLSLSSSLTHVSSSLGSVSDTLAIGEFSTFTATFTVNDDAYYFGGTRNVASVQADAPRVIGGTQTVTDTSENVDHPIEDPLIEVTKTVSHTDTDGDGEVSIGDVLVYNVTLENIGNVTLQSIFLVDNFSDVQGNARNYDGAGLQFNNDSSLGSAERVLLAKEVATYTATYTIVGADVTAGGVMNQVVATSYIYPNGNATVYAQDESDDGDDEDGNTQDDETITFTGQLSSFEVTKTAAKVDDGNGVDNIGDKIVFTITVSNTGADQINGLTFTDTLTSARGVPLSLDSQPEFVSGTNGSTATTLALGGVITYTATFTVSQKALDEGGIYNTITFSGSSARNPNPAEHDTEDVSDNGDDTDGNTEDDPTFFAVGLDNDQDGIPDLLDIDDDNDGVLDTFEKCIDFSVDGFSFENYDTGGGGPVDSNTNYNSTFPVANKVAPFTSVDGRGRIWDTRLVNGKNWTPYDPSNPDEEIFMELLQSATISGTADPANTQAYWNETSYGIPDFDRIMAQEYVYPNTTYNLTFYHMDGGISSATFADGGSTLVQIQGMDSDYAVSQLTEAPSDWAQQTFQFTTGPTTNKIAILFSAYANGSDVAILLDKIGLTPQVSINCDVDSDGVGNGIDLDSDNDGIYDVVEAGNADLDTNGDGMIDENDAGFVDANANGAHDTIEGRTPTDTDSVIQQLTCLI